jgi:DNA-binding GntR family transcriptional regulator
MFNVVYISFMTAINTPTYMRLREQVRADIVSGVWPLGSHVTLAQLSDHYQVSANPVREALLQLQGEGAVEMRMNRGAVIPMVDAKYVHDLYRLRGAIQCMLARDAARMASNDQIDHLQALCSAYEAAAQSADVAACVNANRRLHLFMDRIGDNEMAVDLLQGRFSLVDAYRRAAGYGVNRLDVVIKQHRKLVEAIASKDEEKAAKASLEHTNSARLDLLKMLDRSA